MTVLQLAGGAEWTRERRPGAPAQRKGSQKMESKSLPHPSGYAFPSPNDRHGIDNPGMELRDWFAGQALVALAGTGKDVSRMVDLAYQFADEALKRRSYSDDEIRRRNEATRAFKEEEARRLNRVQGRDESDKV